MSFDRRAALLTVAQSRACDRAAVAAGADLADLMENAGRAVADAILARRSRRSVVVLCGPGNNGGDGFVAACHLARAGWPVGVALLGARERLKGAAARMARRWSGPILPLEDEATRSSIAEAALVVDAVFGAGLTRDVAGAAAAALAAGSAECVAVDVPSGLDGDSGEVRGFARRAALTVAFCRARPGHLLLPGRELRGELVVADIGIGDDIVEACAPSLFRNGPAAWAGCLPRPATATHKHARGHLVVAGGGVATGGAARLVARAGLRAGAGLATVAAPPGAILAYAAAQTSVMQRADASPEAFAELLAESGRAPARPGAVVLGPGQGVSAATRARVMAALATGKPVLLDADALTSFADRRAALFAALHGRCVLTPHEGEFRRLFRETGTRLARAREAAAITGAVVVLKGPDTVIALPEGGALIDADAPPDLATAGSGDVLAGFIGGLLAQGLDAAAAGAIGVWLHGACGRHCGPGLIAEDLPEALPAVLRGLRAEERRTDA